MNLMNLMKANNVNVDKIQCRALSVVHQNFYSNLEDLLIISKMEPFTHILYTNFWRKSI